MLHPVVLARPTRGAGASSALNQYAFSGTLAVQDITCDFTSGTSASRVATRLSGSAESDAFLFALCTTPVGPRQTGAFGFPEIPSTGGGPDVDASAWVFISLPLLEDLRVLEANITLDASIAPLPGEWSEEASDAWEASLSLVDDLSAKLQRHIRQVWVTHSPGVACPREIESAGYRRAFTELQAKVRLADAVAQAHLAYDLKFPDSVAHEMATLYTAASAGLPRGELILDTIAWSPQRIIDASKRLRDKGGEQITAYDVVGGHVVAFSEVMRFAGAEESVIELGATYVLDGFRGRGFGRKVMMAAIQEARKRWPEVSVGYTSYPAASKEISHLNKELGEEVISATTAWQKL
ncbi:GNAT family N-acetyltransferase [Corynebacterium breve]|uniref:GNAT family N-acetyltransferase n=1 Tax=Corynebacterium breve TaxID=3049799 RepID=A0ABY8VBD6_9CORY|nr:GNAT family N-acetyltransferase [Corynebacterium breve]WIM66793.1 GNAT family N-acetyltransferase [Corynebacterium breve]